MTTVRELSAADWPRFSDEIIEQSRPVLIRELVREWPAVRAFEESGERGLRYIEQFVVQRPVTVYVGDPEIEGRFSYTENLEDLNFRSGKIELTKVIERLISQQADVKPAAVYVGSSAVDRWLPGFSSENVITKRTSDTLESFWLGSRTLISAHFDFPHNLACVVGGRRTFRLFPPEQLSNLYIGPLDKTPAGQPISLVDFEHPDLERYPKSAIALENSLEFNLDPGDALFIPSMWWHQVSSLDPINMLVNLWWSETPESLGSPLMALMHAILSVRDIPLEEREHWRRLFDHYVFDPRPENFDHIPDRAKGSLAALSKVESDKLRSKIAKELSQH